MYCGHVATTINMQTLDFLDPDIKFPKLILNDTKAVFTVGKKIGFYSN